MNNEQQNIRITIDAGGNAAQYLDQLLKAANGANSAMGGKGANGMAGGGGANAMSGAKMAGKLESGLNTAASAMGGASGALGAVGALGPYAAAAVAGFMLLEQGIKVTAKTLNTLNDSTKTTAQKMNAFGDEFLPLFKPLRELGEALANVHDNIRQRDDAHDQRMIRLGVEGRAYGGQASAASSYAEAQAQLAARGVAPLQNLNKYDQFSVQGRIGYQEQKLRTGAKDAVAYAERNVFTSGHMVKDAERRLQEARDERTGIAGRRDRANAYVGQLRDRENYTMVHRKDWMNEAVKDAIELQKELSNAEAKIAAEEERLHQARLGQSKALTDLTQKRVDLQKAELTILEQQEQRMAGLRGTLGAMNRGQMNQSAAMLKLIANRGVENLPPGVVASASQLAPDFIRAEQERLGERRANQLRGRFSAAEYERIFGKAEARGETLAGTRASMQRVQAEMRVTAEIDTERVAKDMMAIFERQYRTLIKRMEVETSSQQRMEKLQKMDQRNQQN